MTEIQNLFGESKDFTELTADELLFVSGGSAFCMLGGMSGGYGGYFGSFSWLVGSSSQPYGITSNK